MPPEQGACKHDWQPAIVEGRPWEHCSKCGGWAYTGRHTQECATCPLEGRVVAMEAQRHLQDVLDRQSTELFKEHSEALDAMEARLHALEQQHAELGRLHDEHVLLVHEQPLERPAAPAWKSCPKRPCLSCDATSETCLYAKPAAPAQRQPVLCPACKRAAVATGEMAPHTASSHYTSDIYHCTYGDCWVHAFNPALVPRQGAGL